MTAIRLRLYPLADVVLAPPGSAPPIEPGPCHGCRFGWPVLMCRAGRWHHALGSRVPYEVMQCTTPPELPDQAIARSRLHALSRHPDATAAERHFAFEMLRGPVTVEVAELCRAVMERMVTGGRL